MDKIRTITIFTDGGSRGNPGPSALGVYIEADGETLDEIGKTLGINTNNFAEYSAILEGLNWVAFRKKDLTSLEKVNFFMDSNLAVMQLNGLYKIKSPNLRELLFKAKQLENEISVPVSYTHVPREQNKKADRLVNIALDNENF